MARSRWDDAGWEDRWDGARAALGVRVAFDSAREAAGHGAAAEVLVRRSSGVFVRVTRAGAREEDAWEEEALAVRVVLPDGRTGLAAVGSWDEAREAALRATLLAGTTRRGSARLGASSRRVAPALSAAQQPTVDELHARLAAVEAAALAVDPRVVAVDASLLRSAVIESFLASTAGAAVHQRQAASQVHAAAVARDGLRVASHPDAWAGGSFSPADAERFGRSIGRAALLDLAGIAAVPRGPVLLRPRALAEMTFALAPALLGLVPSRALLAASARDAPAAHLSLRLLEDAAEDDARALPADGAGRPLGVTPVLEGGMLACPAAGDLPLVRPGTADLPQPGWLRLSWAWSPGARDEAELLERLGSGMVIENAATLEADADALSWSGSVAGRWFDQGRERAFCRVPLSFDLLDLLSRAKAGSAASESCHPSGTVRAISLLIGEPEPEG